MSVGKAPARRVAKTGGKELIDQPRHGPTLTPAFMIQRTDDGAIDAGRIVGSPWHKMNEDPACLSPVSSKLYDTSGLVIAVPNQVG